MKRAGKIIVNKDDSELYALSEFSGTPALSYGIKETADFRAVNISEDSGKYSFEVLKSDKKIAEIKLSVLGKFSVYNALAAFCAAYSLGIGADSAAKSLSSFPGIERRLEIIGKTVSGAPIIYDYAHHPSEIKSGILAVREFYKGKVALVFKPHTYTRTRDLFDEFAIALGLADFVYISEIDAIREEKIDGISSESLAHAIGECAMALPDDEITERLKNFEGAILIMGASNLDKIKEFFGAVNLGIDK